MESNACTEYWFLMHFMASPSSKEYATFESIIRDLRKHLPNYDKTEAYFNKTNIYKELKSKGDMPNAINLSKKLDDLRRNDADTYKSYSQMYLLFDILRDLDS